MQLDPEAVAAVPVGEVLAEFPLHESLTFLTWVTIGCPVSGPGVRADEPQRRDDVALQPRDEVACRPVPYVYGPLNPGVLLPCYARFSSPAARHLARSRELLRLARLGGSESAGRVCELEGQVRAAASWLISRRAS
jgi:hypothetical protein